MAAETVETCPATPIGFPHWRCKLLPGHEGDHQRGPLRWPNTSTPERRKS